MTRILLSVLLVVVGVTWVVYGVLTVDRRDDEAQIRSLIRDTAAAVEKRDLSGVMRCVSGDYKDEDGYTYDKLRMLVAQALRAEVRYQASAQVRRVILDGDRAIVEVHARVSSADGAKTDYERDLTLVWQKTRARHAMIIPIKAWRVMKVDNLGLMDL